MDRRTKINLRLFLRRFNRNYDYFLKTYNGKNVGIYLDQFVRDNLKLAETLFGNEGAREFKAYLKNMRTE